MRSDALVIQEIIAGSLIYRWARGWRHRIILDPIAATDGVRGRRRGLRWGLWCITAALQWVRRGRRFLFNVQAELGHSLPQRPHFFLKKGYPECSSLVELSDDSSNLSTLLFLHFSSPLGVETHLFL